MGVVDAMRLARRQVLGDVMTGTVHTAARQVPRCLVSAKREFHFVRDPLSVTIKSVCQNRQDELGPQNMASAFSNQTVQVQGWLDRLRQGDDSAREPLLQFSCVRLWYQELRQAEVAEMLGVSERTIKRRWAAARLELHELLGGALPES
jgi:ECF sigma factor